METTEKYLASLATTKPRHFEVVAAYMLRDKLNLVHPDEGGAGCTPACTGDGSTPNGYWVCSNGHCLWVPAT